MGVVLGAVSRTAAFLGAPFDLAGATTFSVFSAFFSAIVYSLVMSRLYLSFLIKDKHSPARNMFQYPSSTNPPASPFYCGVQRGAAPWLDPVVDPV
ncbi:hypothetical protein TRIP_E190129 [uncultured Spirochaetota bacterium]|nr:hypothetical protein TRIP_E190129 [uncultured Spirochaetota bacterium]